MTAGNLSTGESSASPRGRRAGTARTSTQAAPATLHGLGRSAARLIGRAMAAFAVVVAGVLINTIMVRSTPGFGLDERQLESRLSRRTALALESELMDGRTAVEATLGYVRAALNGDFGISFTSGRPVSELMRERAGVTLSLAAAGLAAGWACGFGFAAASVLGRSRAGRLLPAIPFNAVLCMPVALIGVMAFRIDWPVALALAMVVGAKIFVVSRALLAKAIEQPHILIATAQGISSWRRFTRYIVPSIARELLAAAALSVTVTIGAIVPLEAVCDVPGLGQFAWQSAVARDLPSISAVTLIVAAVTVTVNALCEGDAHA